MDDALQLFMVLAAVTVVGLGAYLGFTVVRGLARRIEAKSAPATPAPEELQAIHERLAETEALEARVAELEERLDFAERLLAQQREPERLPGAHPLEPQH